MRTCGVDGCDKKHVAKGMCGTHYNKAKYPAEVRHRKIPHVCDGCGITFEREARVKRYANIYCSNLCRDYAKGSIGTCKLPAEHWALMYGATCTFKPARCIDCSWCGTAIVTTLDTQQFCTRTCKIKAAKAKRRAAEHNAIGVYTWAQIARLWVAFDKGCAYCARPTALTDIQAEHVQALSRGGANNLSNLLPSCGPCNSDKRELTLDEWATDRVRRKLPPVTTTWTHTDPRYAHLSTGRSLAHLAA